MKKLTTRWGIFFLIFAVLFAIVWLIYPDEYTESYQREIVYQYDYLRSMADENKIVCIGASTLSFGLDMDTMEQETGMPVVILGNHLGFGTPYTAEMSKPYLKSGDKVVIELRDQTMTEGAVLLILTGVGRRIDMYRFMVPELWWNAINTVPLVIRKGISEAIDGGLSFGGAYSIYAYDERGNMTFERGECEFPKPYNGESGWLDVEATPLNEDFADYLNDYIAYCNDLGVDVYFTVMHSFDEQVITSDEVLDERDAIWASQLDAPLISRTVDYKIPRKYIWDGHCNSAGQIYRTELICRDLKPYLD